MNFEPRCLATAIGSLPHADAAEAVRVVLANIPDAPIWPQLPANGLNEQMEIQYTEGIPRVVIDREKQRMYIDTTGDTSIGTGRLLREASWPTTWTRSAITPGVLQGHLRHGSALEAAGGTRPFVKVQTTGPLSFGLTIVDENKRAIYYNDEFVDVVVKALAMKCRWQIRKFRPYAEKVICFIDEPILSAFGSSTYVSVTRDDVVAKLSEVIDAVHAEGALAGIHCCGNTEWRILIDAGVDIVNFDAFDYGETIALYPEAVKRHLEAGKALAWGIVPTNSAKIQAQTRGEPGGASSTRLVDNLAKAAGIDRELILRQALITPSCGTGSLPVADAERVFATLRKRSSAGVRALACARHRSKKAHMPCHHRDDRQGRGRARPPSPPSPSAGWCGAARRPVLAVDADSNANLDEALGVSYAATVGGIREERAPAGRTR